MKATKKQINVLTESVEKVVKMLVSRNISVTQEGSRAYVKYNERTNEPERVNIPIITEDAPLALLEAVQGFVDGEVSHILFSDAKYQKQAEEKNIKGLYDIADDIMAENRINMMYRGSRSNLVSTYDHYLNDIVAPKIEKLKAEGADPVKLFMEGYAVPAVRAWGGQQRFQDFMKDRWDDIAEIANKIPEELKDQLSFARNSQEAFGAASRLAEVLVQDPPPPSEKDDKSDGDGKGKQGGKPGGKGKGGDNKQGQGEESTVGGGSGDDEGKGEGTGSDKDAGSTPEEGTEQGSTRGEEQNGEKVDGRDRSGYHTERSEWPDFNDMKGMGDSMMEYIADMSTAANSSGTYKPYTTRFDKVEMFSPRLSSSRFDESRLTLESMVEDKIANLSKNLERVIAARSKRQNVGGFRSGRIHTSNLYRLSLGDDRVFRRRQETTTKDIAAQIIVDCSGSMRGSRYRMAIASGYAICKALDKLGINNEMCGFTTHSGGGTIGWDYSSKVMRELRQAAEQNNEGNFSRFEPLYLPIFKAFGERVINPNVRNRIINGFGCDDHLANNIDGESIEVHSRRLMAQPQKGKLLIVLSDGAPAASHAKGLAPHLKRVVQDMLNSGISVFGIGIQTNSVESFYPYRAVINEVDQLPGVIGGTLRGLILKQLGA